jgi:hypothetical protein
MLIVSMLRAPSGHDEAIVGQGHREDPGILEQLGVSSVISMRSATVGLPSTSRGMPRGRQSQPKVMIWLNHGTLAIAV